MPSCEVTQLNTRKFVLLRGHAKKFKALRSTFSDTLLYCNENTTLVPYLIIYTFRHLYKKKNTIYAKISEQQRLLKSKDNFGNVLYLRERQLAGLSLVLNLEVKFFVHRAQCMFLFIIYVYICQATQLCRKYFFWWVWSVIRERVGIFRNKKKIVCTQI